MRTSASSRRQSLRQKVRDHTLLNAERLLSNVSLQKEVADIRVELGLPVEGFATQKDADSWWERNLRFKFSVNALRNPSPSDTAIIDRTRILEAGITSLRRKYELSELWRPFLENLILRGAIDESKLPAEVHLEARTEESTGVVRLFVELSPNTTIRDIEAFWPEITTDRDDFLKKHRQKRQPTDTQVAERDRLAAEMQTKGNTMSEIAEVLSAKFDKAYSYSEIPKFIERHHARAGES
jgi:hypothetical protein